MEDSKEEVREQGVIFAIQSNVAGVFVSAACENHGQIGVVVVRGISQVAGVENTRMIQQRPIALRAGF